MRFLRVITKQRLLRFFKFIGITFLLYLVIMYCLIYFGTSRSAGQSWELWKEVIPGVVTHPFFYVLLLIPFGLYLIGRSLFFDFKKKRWVGLLRGFALKILLPVVVFFGMSAGLKQFRLSESFEYTWDTSVENHTSTTRGLYEVDGKQRGIHVFGISSNPEDLEKLKTNNFEWITLTSFIGQQEYNAPEINVPSEESFQRIKDQYAKVGAICDSLGIKIMIKPHIWLRENEPGKWRSNIEMKDEEAWDLWFEKYEATMLGYARIATEIGAAQFCLGTELETTVREKPGKWRSLIANIKEVYSGKLTYAANWNEEYQQVPFWDMLDYIGIQAYFPLSEGLNPTLEELEASWAPFVSEIKTVSETFNKPVLFTEIGYRSLKGTSKTPWEWAGISHWFSRISKKEQYLCYEAFFNTVWNEPWFHGLHIWEWQGRMTDGDNTSFSVEYKPAMNLIAKRFSQSQ